MAIDRECTKQDYIIESAHVATMLVGFFGFISKILEREIYVQTATIRH